MILEKLVTRPNIHSISDVLNVLRKCQRTVVRLARQQGPVCTGFFILPSVVLAPAFPFETDDTDEVVVEAFRGGKRVWSHRQSLHAIEFLAQRSAELEPWTRRNGALFALIPVESTPPRWRTSGDEGDGLLELGFDTPDAGQFVAVLQFPGGRPEHGISFGSVHSCTNIHLTYDADTERGSSGGPILNQDWRVAGVHFGVSSSNVMLKQGITRAALVAALRQSRAWPEIEDRHRIADVAAAQKNAAETPSVVTEPHRDPLVLRAALSAFVPKALLTEDEAATLRPLIANPEAEQWVLRPGERTRAIRSAGSLAELRKHAATTNSALSPTLRRERGFLITPTDPLQNVIDRILEGPPYDLDAEDPPALAWWIQASRWFAGVDDAIPTPGAVARVLGRKRSRSRLDDIAGNDFRGRKAELAKLTSWWTESKKPLSLTGIGGIGKSALIARFASALPSSTLLLWLDFDRADLAPDDARSVLSILSEQAAIQLETFTPRRVGTNWSRAARGLGSRINKALPRGAAVLLVLDSFEAAQYRERYQELWPVLEEIARNLPRLRLAVTGRAPVPGLRLAGEDALSLHVGGLAREDAAQWLRDHGVHDPSILERVVDLAGQVPLILRMALRFLDRGGRAEELPDKLPPAIVAGFLYDRILDRVQNPLLKPLAMSALVTRRLSAEMMEPVFGGLTALPEGDASKWFGELAREMALVEGTDVLKLRSEVRTPALLLLEKDQPALVKAVDERAVDWYRTKSGSNPELLAELIYHSLRLGDKVGAEKAWRDDCRKFLRDVGADMPEAGRAWLAAQGVGVDDHDAAQATNASWEVDAVDRIRTARARGNARVVKKILLERKDRSAGSALIFHDAYELWLTGYRTSALDLLEEAGEAPGPVGRDRTVLRALLLAEAADDRAAKTLASVEDVRLWHDLPFSELHALAVRAARIRLTIDVETECSLIARERMPPHSEFVPVAAVLPLFRRQLMSDHAVLESVNPAREVHVGATVELAELIGRIRTRLDRRIVPALPSPLLLALARQRWALATPDFLFNAYDAITILGRAGMTQAITGTLALFAPVLELTHDEQYVLTGTVGPLFDLIASRNPSRSLPRRFPHWKERVIRVLRDGVDPDTDWERDIVISGPPGNERVGFRRDLRSLPPEQRAVVVQLFSPNPLEQLVHELAGHLGMMEENR